MKGTALNKFQCYTFFHWSEECLQDKSVWKLDSYYHLKMGRTEVTTKGATKDKS